MSIQNLKTPPPLAATDRSSFAYKTIKDRLPVILVKTIDFLHRQRKELHKFGGTLDKPTEEQMTEIEADAKTMISHITKLRKDLETDKPTELLERIPLDSELDYFNDDIDLWNKKLEENRLVDSLPCYFKSAWLLVECYLYRKIKDAALTTKHLKMYDPFVEQKQAAMKAALPQMLVLTKHLLDIEKEAFESANDTHPSERTEFGLFTKLALWANKCDLSLSNMSSDNVQSQNLASLSELRESLDELQANILCDNLSELWFKVQSIKSAVRGSTSSSEPIYVDLVADNSGYEIFTDLCLLHALSLLLAGSKPASKSLKIRLHLKRMPWFVSDALRQDVDWLLDYMKVYEKEESFPVISEKWRSFFSSGLWEIHDHKFWTLPHDYSEMSSVCEDLHSTLAKSSLIIFKGDLNYRKLVGDRKWHILTPFRTALRGFMPAPLVTLRTTKADVVVGIEDINIFARINNNEFPRDWMISGEYAVIQFVDPM